jgi:hypothetical protein
MTRLRPVVVPVTALVLATAAPSAVAQPRRPVEKWVDTPSTQALAAQLADLPPRAALVQPATSLPLAVLTPSGEAAVPDVRHASAASPAAAGAAGRPLLATARGPPR